MNMTITKRQVSTAAIVAAALLLTLDPAFAQGAAGGGGSLVTFLNNLVNIITGAAGQAIAVIAVAVVGIGVMFGSFSARGLGGLVFGIALVFSASWVVSQITGGAGGTTGP